MEELNIILKETDGEEHGYEFVEVEDEDGRSVDGEWIDEYDLYHEAVRIEVGE
jgi:hypothetical protein